MTFYNKLVFLKNKKLLLLLIINFINSFRTKIKKDKKDKIQPVSQRFKLRSCTFLIVEQTNYVYCYNILEKIIQHRGSRHIYR